MDDADCYVGNGESNEACQRLQEENGEGCCRYIGEQGGEQQVQGVGDDFLQIFFDDSAQGCHQQHSHDPASARGQGIAVQGDGGQIRMADKRSQNAADDRCAAEFFG